MSDAQNALIRASNVDPWENPHAVTAEAVMAQGFALTAIAEALERIAPAVNADGLDVAPRDCQNDGGVCIGSRVVLGAYDERGRWIVRNDAVGTVAYYTSLASGDAATVRVKWDDGLAPAWQYDDRRDDDDESGESTHPVTELRVVLGV